MTDAGWRRRLGRTREWGFAVLLWAAAMASGCHAQQSTATHLPDTATTANQVSDQQQLHDLYTRLVDAIGRHDTAEQLRLTCAEFQSNVQSRADSDHMLRIDFLGTPEAMRRVGVDAATDKLLTALAPASREAVRDVVEAIINDDAAQYKTAIHRVEVEGSSAKLDRLDNIQVTGDTATVDGAFTMKAFTRPPEIVTASNQAVRVNGAWMDCTPPRHQG